MASTIASDVVGRVLEYTSGSIAERIAPYFGGREKLNELHKILTFIQARLSDAERHHEGGMRHLTRAWLEKLKIVMYQLEDLFEEVDWNDKENEQRSENEQRFSSKLSKLVVCECFLHPNLSSLRMHKKVAKEGESILSMLNQLKNTMDALSLVPGEVNVGDSQSRLNLDDIRETESFIMEGEVIGRDNDRDVIVDMLLKSNNVEKVLSVIPIVGIGGLGKTTLAQFVYKDERVKRVFENRYWACMSDKISSLKELNGKVLQSMTNADGWHQWSLEKLHSEFRKFVRGKKLLLVLDDVWNEDREMWIQFRDLLYECKPGSALLVTTRSHMVALNMSTVPSYELQGLSEDQSWALFKSLAFRKSQEESSPNLANIGREILKKCVNVPLAIKTTARLLYSRTTEEEWVLFRDKEIGLIDRTYDILSILKLSYDHLKPKEKQCFAYCSLYPHDYEFDIKDLIWRWMAQGFVKSMDDGVEVFTKLLQICFFQDVTLDEYGNMEGCKMHDLIHDLALSVGDECRILDKPVEHIIGNIRHVTVIIDGDDSLSAQEASWICASPPIRSFFLPFGLLFDCHVIFSHLMQLRALDLGEEFYESLPASIGKLLHLRYLKANVGCLPEGITTLQSLQVLNVRVKELPRGFHKLTSLRHLEICSSRHNCLMPSGIRKLVNLETLGTFVVGNDGLDALAGLNLTVRLRIDFLRNRGNAISEATMSNLKGKTLTHLLMWQGPDYSASEDDDEVFNCLQLPSTLKILEVCQFEGVRRLSWGIHDLPNIVYITIDRCSGLRHLPSLGRLPYLKMLRLGYLEALEFIENEAIASSSETRAVYFPSLEMLTLHCLPSLKQWSRIEDTDIDQQVELCQQLPHCFPRLLTLKMKHCLNLTSLPWSQFAALNYGMPQMLESVDILQCDALDLSACEGLQSLRSLEIQSMDNLKALPEECIRQLTQLRSLSIKRCQLVEALPRSICDLHSLKELYIWDCPQLKRRFEKPDGEDWPLIQHIPYVDIH